MLKLRFTWLKMLLPKCVFLHKNSVVVELARVRHSAYVLFRIFHCGSLNYGVFLPLFGHISVRHKRKFAIGRVWWLCAWASPYIWNKCFFLHCFNLWRHHTPISYYVTNHFIFKVSQFTLFYFKNFHFFNDAKICRVILLWANQQYHCWDFI